MQQHLQRDDVALGREIRLRVEHGVETVEVAAPQVLEIGQLLHVVHHHVSQVHLAPLPARDVPPSPAEAKLGVIRHQDRSLVSQLLAVSVHIGGHQQEARDTSAGVREGVVTAEAGLGLALEVNLRRAAVLQRVEDLVERTVHRAQLHLTRPLHPADVGVLVEVDRARARRLDLTRLQARL